MTTQEFSNEFDILLNSYTAMMGGASTASPINLDEYEKSVLLTEAQNSIVIGLYTGRLTGEALERSEELRRELDSLIETTYPEEIDGQTGVSSSSVFYQLDPKVWYIIYESADLSEGAYCESDPSIQVIPMKIDEWHRAKKNPFRMPDQRKAVRLDAGDHIVEIISKYPITNYLVRYLRKPNPIILTDLEDDLSIDGLQTITECELSTVLHRIILEAAVQLAARRLPSSGNKNS